MSVTSVHKTVIGPVYGSEEGALGVVLADLFRFRLRVWLLHDVSLNSA